MGEAVGVEARLDPVLSIGGVGGRVRGTLSTGFSLGFSPELSIWDVKSAAVGARLAPVLSVGGGRGIVRAANGSVGRLFSTVSRIVGVLVVRFMCLTAAAAQVLFEGETLPSPE